MTEATVAIVTDSSHVRIALGGEIDASNVDTVEHQIADAIPNEVNRVTVDFGDLHYMDSAGLHMLARLAGRLEQMNVDLALVAPPMSPAGRVIELSGLGLPTKHQS